MGKLILFPSTLVLFICTNFQQNNWNALGCDVSESLLLDTSTKLVDSGLRDVGYNYVVLDDCWSDGRDENEFLKVDLEKFPSGMKAVADEIHRQGLLFGMYSSAGEMTCARYGVYRVILRSSRARLTGK